LKSKNLKSNDAKTRARKTYNLNPIFYLKARDWGLPGGFGAAHPAPEAYPPKKPSGQSSAILKQVVHRQLNVAQNRAKKAWPDRLTSMHWHRSYSAIGMPQK
jgi:hypothetical protein